MESLVRYFDANATTPLHPAARAAWLQASADHWHNPSSLSGAATEARECLDDARETLGELLGCEPQRILFTGSATAANNGLARHLAKALNPVPGELLISAVEHPSFAVPMAAALPGRVRELPVDEAGRVLPAGVEEELAAAAKPAFLSLLAANNETGVLHDWEEMAGLCRHAGVWFHTDASQWIGKLPPGRLGRADFVTGSSHKFGGPKGVGFLVVPGEAAAFTGDQGGPQQQGRWAGTENLPGIVAMVAALEAVARETEGFAGAMRQERQAARDDFERVVMQEIPGAIILGRQAERLWNTSAVLLPGHDGRRLVAAVERQGIAASTGAACSSGSDATAKAVTAIGFSRLGLPAGSQWAMLRLSAGWSTTAADWQAAAQAVSAVVQGAGPLPRISLG